MDPIRALAGTPAGLPVRATEPRRVDGLNVVDPFWAKRYS